MIWDTDQCRLRYISTGEPDSYPYLRSNGNALAKVGDIVHREPDPIFSSKELEYTGYHLNGDGFPSFAYRIGDTELTETYAIKEGAVVRSIKATPTLPAYELPKNNSPSLNIETTQTENSITVTYFSK